MSLSFDDIFAQAQDHHTAGRIAQAAELYENALAIQPRDADCLFLLGLTKFQLRQPAPAANLIRQAIAIDGAVAEYHCDLARILFSLNDFTGAITAARRAVQLRPDFPEAHFNLGNALCKTNLLEDGIDAFQQALALRPEAPDAMNNLAMALLSLGQVDSAIDWFDKILKIDPTDAAAHSNRIYAMHFSPAYTAAAIRQELLRWNHQHAAPLTNQVVPHANRPPNHPLRIGYVSPDFRAHVVGWNLLPFIGHHDPAHFQIYCYSSVRHPDAVTQQLKSMVPVWRDISEIPGDRAAQMIREDAIDILIDLSLHTGGNRLLVFARKPAPIQLTYLGYPGSTGVTAIDYRLSDPFIDSPDEESQHTERTIRLPHTYWCYKPGGPTPPVGPLPARQNKFITFGCLNQYQKVSAPTLNTWQQILHEVKQSRLILHAPPGKHREQIIARLNIDSNRIVFVERLPWPQYIQTYQRIDIALDPFPHGGGITTCDALWMGVPTITLRGATAVGRGSSSVLHNLELDHCITHAPTEYINAAQALAGDFGMLENLRSSLRNRLAQSPLMNGQQFALDFEVMLLQLSNQI